MSRLSQFVRKPSAWLVLRAARNAFSLAAIALVAVPSLAAPTITAVSPRGLQIGRPTTLVITGTDLPADLRLVSEAKLSAQKVQPGAKATRVEIEVELDEDVPPGLYAVRVAGRNGISSPVAMGVDRLPQRAFGKTIDELPAAFSGTVNAAEVISARLKGKTGQRLIIDVEAQRLGSGLKPVVRLSDHRGTQIAWSPPRAIIGGDARIETTLPADGDYTIELQDELFRPAGPGFFRLKVGDLQYADLAMPLGVALGSKQSMSYASANVLGAVELDATNETVPGEASAPLPSSETFTGAAPRVAITEFAELVEMPTAEGPQALASGSVAISGLLAEKAEVDKYQLAVKPGQKLRLEMTARQFGSPIDGVVTIRKEDGSQVAMGDDRPGSSDPLVDFTVPAGANKLLVEVKDLLDRGGPDFVYRIVVREQSRPDYALSLATDKLTVPAGGTQVVPVQLTRMNYNGPVELSLETPMSDLTLKGNIIPAGATIGLLTLTASDGNPSAIVTRVIGRATEAQLRLVRAAMSSDVPGAKYQPRLRSQLGLAISEPSPIRFAWLPGDNDQLYLGSKMPVRVQFTRATEVKGKVRLRLLTSQPRPKKTVKENNQDKIVDDIERTLRLEGDATFGPEQTDVTVNILVPGDLPRQPWDLVLVAELLSADGKNVVSSLASPVRTLEPVAPFSLALTGDNAAEGKAGAGEPGKLTGKIERSPGYKQPLVVTLESLPRGYRAPQVLVAGDKSEFELPLTFNYAGKPGDIKAKLVALAAPVIATSVKSNAIDVAVRVVTGEKPETEQPKEVFEDDEKFIAMLTEGNGRAIPDQRDQYSGTYSLRVTPDQKFNAKLPNLNVKIRENPGPGEYRYLRFAWKKAQGNSVCLQLAHDGKFGPASGAGREGAKFRYHAGSAEEPFGASLQVSDKIPAKFEVVTRDLFVDFGEFTFTGLAFSPVDGQAALFDHIYLARQLEDLEQLKPGK
jgi:hypothetical protein